MSIADVSSGTAYAGRDANHALSFRQFNKSKHAQYFTPLWLAELIFESLHPLVPAEGPSSISVLDPTCGSGRLLAPWKEAGAQVLGVELDQVAADHARFAIGNQNVRTGDLLDYRHLLTGFSLVITNPPYGIFWTPPDAGEVWTCETSGGLIESQGATLDICARALAYGGYLVAIIPTSTFANTKERVVNPPEQKASLRDDLGDLKSNWPWMVLFFVGLLWGTALHVGADVSVSDDFPPRERSLAPADGALSPALAGAHARAVRA